MAGMPVVIATNGYGIPVVEAVNGLGMPVERVFENGLPVVVATNGYGLPVMPAVPFWVQTQAGLDLDLVNNRAWNGSAVSTAASLLTTARAGTAYADSVAGVWSSFAANTPRITDKGLLVEEARTNSVRNNSAQGAVPGTPGTPPTNWIMSAITEITQTIVGTGTENGIDYIDVRYSGTVTAARTGSPAFDSAVVASNTQVWTSSVFLKLVAGSWTNVTARQHYCNVLNSGSTFSSSLFSTNVTPDSTLTRYSTTATIADVNAAFLRPGFTFTTGTSGAIDFTIRIGWPQLELGAFVTSPIRTTTVAVARAADVVTRPTVLSAPLTLYAQGRPNAPVGYATGQLFVHLDDGSTANRTFLVRNGASSIPVVNVTIASVAALNSNLSGSALAAGALGKVAVAVAAGDQVGCLNGGTVVTASGAGSPAASTTLRIGVNVANVQFWNGWMERVTVWSSRLTNAQLQSITT